MNDSEIPALPQSGARKVDYAPVQQIGFKRTTGSDLFTIAFVLLLLWSFYSMIHEAGYNSGYVAGYKDHQNGISAKHY